MSPKRSAGLPTHTPCPRCGRKKAFSADLCRPCRRKENGVLSARNSLASRAATDPDLRRRIREGRERAGEEARFMEAWARRGATAGFEVSG